MALGRLSLVIATMLAACARAAPETCAPLADLGEIVTPSGGPPIPELVDGDAAAHTTWTLAETAREEKEIAAENRCAFWDLREATGGDASALELVRTKKMESDKRHFTREGGFWVGDRLAFALWRGVTTWAKRNEGAGCAAR